MPLAVRAKRKNARSSRLHRCLVLCDQFVFMADKALGGYVRTRTVGAVIVLAAGVMHLSCHGSSSPTAGSEGLFLPQSRGRISICLDDGYVSQYMHALPILERAGFHGTFYIVTRYIGFPAYMDQGQLKNLYGRGHEIGGHTYSHTSLLSLTDAQVREEVTSSKQQLISFGLPPVDTFAYPFGDYDPRIEGMVRSAAYVAARTVDGGTNMLGVDRYALRGNPVSAGTSLATVQRWIDDADRSGAWLILVFHRFDEDGNSISIRHELFQNITDYLLQKRLPVITVREGIRAL
jgi:peptidoglycan/xylan/chitin deacetylase (PgdA/CDA1 family)